MSEQRPHPGQPVALRLTNGMVITTAWKEGLMPDVFRVNYEMWQGVTIWDVYIGDDFILAWADRKELEKL